MKQPTLNNLAKSLVFSVMLCIPAIAVHAEDVALKVEITPVFGPTETFKNDETFTVKTAIRNIGKEGQVFHVWACSSPEQWKADSPFIGIALVPCDLNGLINIRLKPGEAYTKDLTVRVSAPAKELAMKSVTFRLGFQSWTLATNGLPQVESIPLVWSNPITIGLRDDWQLKEHTP